MNAKKMLVDCRKVREKLEIWRNKSEKSKWKLLGWRKSTGCQ